MGSAGAPTARGMTLTWVWIGYWIFLFLITHIPLGGLRLPAEGGDKVIHFLGYFVLAILAGRAAVYRGVTLTVGWTVSWGVILLIYAAADEFLQQFVNRTPSWRDWYADAVGVLFGLVIVFTVQPQAENPNDPRES